MLASASLLGHTPCVVEGISCNGVSGISGFDLKYTLASLSYQDLLPLSDVYLLIVSPGLFISYYSYIFIQINTPKKTDPAHQDSLDSPN